MEEDANRFSKPRFYQQQHHNAEFEANPRSRGKPCSHFFLKFLFIAMFLSLLPLFPSDPPEFLSHTVIAKSWELIHLLIIGIALSYGLFCRPKSLKIPPKPQISQPYPPNFLHHSSIFDYEETNPSQKNAIPTQSCNLPYFRAEPFVTSRRENGRNFDEMPLGLPVRSLRSRVVDSDSEDDEEEGCSSESSSMSRCEKDDILEGNVGHSTPNLGESQSMRSDFFMAENGSFEAKQRTQFQSFRSPVTEASSCQKFSGFCSWLPESPSTERVYPWKENSFYMPFSKFSQVHDFDKVGITPNSENTTNFFKPSPVVPPSVPFSGTDFATSSETNKHWGISNLENGNFTVENTVFSIPSSAINFPMPFPASESASRSRKYDHETGNWSKSPNLQNGNLNGGSPIFLKPSTAFSLSTPASTDNFPSSVQESNSAKLGQGLSLKKKDEMRSENSNVVSGGENNVFIPSVAFSPSMSTSAEDFASSVIASRVANFNNGPSPKKKGVMRSGNHNVAFVGENTNVFIPSAAYLPSMPTPTDGSGSSVAKSKNARFNHGSSPKTKDEMISENVDTDGENANVFIPSAGFSPSISVFAQDSASSVKASRTATFNNGPSPKERDAMRAGTNNVVLVGENTNNFIPSAAFLPSMPAPTDGFASSVAESKSASFNHGSSLKMKDELLSENVALGRENANLYIPSAAFLSSMSVSAEDCASSVKASKTAKLHNGTSLKKKDEMRSESNRVSEGSFQEGENSYTLHFDSPKPSGGNSPKLENGNSGGEASLIKASRNAKYDHDDTVKKDEEGSEKKNEPIPIPERWGSDCFVIPPSEDNDLEDLLQEHVSPSHIDSSEASSCHEEESPCNRVEEIISISELKDILRENDSYKPSTPSPPPRVQTRRNDDVASSVESSSRALEIRSLINDDDNQGSPPTPERRKALSRSSNSRRFSCGPFFDRDLRKSLKEEAREANRKTKGDHNQFPRGRKCGWDCLKLDVKPTLNKAALKGKSVRTIKPKEVAQEQKREENNEMVVIKIGISEKKTNTNGQKGAKLQGETSILVGLNSKQNSNSTAAVLNDTKEEENDSEIDRKADEFIAKFKEQIRLQKVVPRARGDSRRQH